MNFRYVRHYRWSGLRTRLQQLSMTINYRSNRLLSKIAERLVVINLLIGDKAYVFGNIRILMYFINAVDIPRGHTCTCVCVCVCLRSGGMWDRSLHRSRGVEFGWGCRWVSLSTPPLSNATFSPSTMPWAFQSPDGRDGWHHYRAFTIVIELW